MGCPQLAAADPEKPAPSAIDCGCGSVVPYVEAFAYAVLDMHRAEQGRDKAQSAPDRA
jgi:hypothetical protein